ncbi:MAG: hypothetical protein K8S56_09280, partial [Candidatus Cloacimonetes bacterium]|nr:hypothetical protein [Candidatus Cloacimonadota bacterium]
MKSALLDRGKFCVYETELMYSEASLDIDNFTKRFDVEIQDTDFDLYEDGNNYASSYPSGNILRSYDNDRSPVSDDIVEVGDVIFNVGVQTERLFLFKTLRYWEIRFNNTNSRSYINGLVWVRFGKNSINIHTILGEVAYSWGEADGDKPTGGLFSPSLIFFDIDRTTPIPCVYRKITDDAGDVYYDMLLQFPYIHANTVHTFFLAEPDLSDPFFGISMPLTWLNRYGAWLDIEDADEWSWQTTIFPSRIL